MIFLYPTRFFEKKYHISSYSTTSNGLKSLKYLKSLKILNTLNAKNIPHHSPHTIRDDIKPYHIPVLCHTAHLHPQSTGEKRTLGYQYKKVGHSIKEKKIVFGGIQKLTMKEGMHRTLAAASATLPACEQLKRAFWCQLGGCRVDNGQHNHKRQHQNACYYKSPIMRIGRRQRHRKQQNK